MLVEYVKHVTVSAQYYENKLLPLHPCCNAVIMTDCIVTTVSTHINRCLQTPNVGHIVGDRAQDDCVGNTSGSI